MFTTEEMVNSSNESTLDSTLVAIKETPYPYGTPEWFYHAYDELRRLKKLTASVSPENSDHLDYLIETLSISLYSR